MKITDLKPNSKNPRIISDHKLEKLKKSVREFELMMEARPIVVNSKMEILGGNMRYKALEQLGYTEIPDNWVKVMNFNRKEEKEFIIKDNIGYGDWDWDGLDGWDAEELNDWGLSVPVINIPDDLDYGILDEEDVQSQLDEMTSNVKKAIQIEFDLEHYDEAVELVKFWRERDAYVGYMIMEFLRKEKSKL